jgi:heptosyltransferase-3
MNLVFHQAALGDCVLTFPLLRAMQPPVTLVSAWSKAWLASRVVEGVRPMDAELWEFTRLWSATGPTSLSPAIRDLFATARCIVSFISTGDDAWAANVRRWAPDAPIAFVAPRPPADWTAHVTGWHQSELSRQGVELPAAPGCQSQRPPNGGASSPATGVDGPVVVHVGSGGVDKCWPADRFERLIAGLRDAGRTVIPILGEAEADRWPERDVIRWRDALGARLLLSVEDLYPLLRSASGYIGNDSGPTHLAAHIGLPTVVLFGPSSPRVWRPLGPAVTVLAPPEPAPMSWLSVEAVLAACPPTR